MNLSARNSTTTRREQLRIKATCHHPTARFVEFSTEEVEQSIPQRFEQIAGMYPERPAFKHGNVVHTYESLNRAANTLAHFLLEDSQETVAFLSDRRHGVVAILGILKAGKTYIGLDPSTPDERNAFYLRDAGARYLVTDHAHYEAARALAQDGQRIIDLEELGVENDSNPRLELSPDAAAGIFYTSGSTGQPKGVIQSHRNILHDTLVRVNDYHICLADRLAITQSLSFSASIRAVFPGLLVGAALLSYDLKGNTVSDFAQWVDAERISLLLIRRQILGAFVALRGNGCTFSHLRLLQLGGEPVYGTDVKTFQKHMPEGCVLSLQYSSTEAGAIAMFLVDKRSVVNEGGAAPVGYPCDDTEVCLVDDQGNEVAGGEVGEIFVKSRYLSPGYWHRPDLTNRVFSDDPRSLRRRIYRTGDLGRFSPEGCLVHLGRNDSQIKIRGYRVEITEVEQLLLEHPSVRQAVVKGFTQDNGDMRLVAYLVRAGGQNPTVSELRRHLGTRLADYMIPSTFVLLEEFPTTVSGKIDRNALSAPDRSRPELTQPYHPPGNVLERKLAQMWGDLLQLDRVGIHDNFLELGGHSLLATQLVNRIRDSLQVAVPVSAFLEASTISGLAGLLETMAWLGEKPHIVGQSKGESETF